MSPKSLLRHPQAISSLDELATGTFQEVIGDGYAEPKKVKRVLLCTGKIYYDLLEKQQADQRTDVAIVRLEQIYPLPLKQLDAALAGYKKPDIFWVQEEPENMGCYSFLLRRLREKFTGTQALRYVGRESASSPATGFAKLHTQEQAELVQRAFE